MQAAKSAPDEPGFATYFFQRSLIVTRAALVLAILLLAIFGILDLWMLPESYAKAWRIRYLGLVPINAGLLALTFTRIYRRHSQALLAAGTLPTGLGLVALLNFTTPGEAGYEFYVYGLVLYVMNVFILSRIRFVIACVAAGTPCLAYLAFEFFTRDLQFADPRFPLVLNHLFFLASAFLIGLFANLYLEYFMRRDYENGRIIARETNKNEALLLSIFPAAVAERLKNGEQLIAERANAATCVFMDLVGFTALAHRHTPEDIVRFLNRIYSAFDRLLDRHGLEKIKTIGDSYMAVAGLPEARDDHALAAARFAFSAQRFLRRSKTLARSGIALRIGINSGPVVAGVIGTRKYAYDVWGDTVNVASRMESTGEAGVVHISASTRDLLIADARCDFRFVDRGLREVKGKGPLRTFYIFSGAGGDDSLEVGGLQRSPADQSAVDVRLRK